MIPSRRCWAVRSSKARGPRKADLLAHLGWADFLRWREGQRQLDPADRYRQALAVDPSNVYAHAMLGHWLLWSSDSVVDANRHFDAALQSGRERPFVRRLQLAGLGNKHDAVTDIQMRIRSPRRYSTPISWPAWRKRRATGRGRSRATGRRGHARSRAPRSTLCQSTRRSPGYRGRVDSDPRPTSRRCRCPTRPRREPV